MKRYRFFAAALLALTSVAFGATTTPVSLINPAGSTAGQAIISAGPSSPPVWGAVPLTGISGTLAIANGGTGATSASAALTNLGAAALAGATFTSTTGVGMPSGNSILFSSSSAGSQRAFNLQTAGVNRWSYRANTVAEGGSNAGSDLEIAAYSDAGTALSIPISVKRSTGVVTYSAIPVQPTPSTADNSTNSTTTAYVVAKLASPTPIGSTAANTGAFTTLNASGNDALLYSYSGAQSIANSTTTTVAGFTKVYDRLNANFNATTGTFTAPATGYYQVGGAITFGTAAGVSGAVYSVAVVANGTTVATGRFDQSSTASTAVQVQIPYTVVSLTSGQTIIIQVNQNTGAARSLSTAATSLAISRLP